jgi:polysaccharide deacetylase/Big-like domain-containing protein/chitobiase/beta-hexosaminidase-like protein
MRVSLVCVALGAVGCGDVETGVTVQAVGDPTTIVSLTFDDTFADQAQVAEMASARGMRVTFFVNSARIDHAGSMTSAQLLAFQGAGHEIGGHTISHADLPTLDLSEAKRQVCNDRVALLNAGFAASSFAYPFGDNNAAVEQVVADCNYNAARDVGGIVSNGSCSGCPFANTVPPQKRMAVRTPDSIKIDTTLEDMQGYVLQAEQHGGGWVPLVFHHVCDGCNSLSVSPATLAAFLDWLEARSAHGTVVKTMGEVIGGSLQPGVDGPPPDEGATGLVLQNPSLEDDANHDQIPDCWQRGGSGTNTATYTLESPGFDGAIAQRIDVTALTSGARRIVTRQDLGACAPVAYPGHSYTVTAYYKSNTQPHFTVYYRDPGGSWIFLAQGPALPASATYLRGSYTTPAYPDGTTAISVGLSILAVGSLTMDQFTLVDTDATPPAIDFATPADGATASGTVDIAIAASDAGGLAKVELLINGTATVVPPPYVYHWDTTLLADSVVSVAARATDLAGNVAITPSRLVTIANAPADTTPPVVAVTAPVAAAMVRGTIEIAAAATDDVAVHDVELFVDGVSIGSLDTAPYAVAWPSTSHADGTAVITARAIDHAGNAATSAPLEITVDNTPPASSIACNGAPCAGFYAGDVTVTLAATDAGSGPAAIRYSLDGSDPTTVYTGPFVVTADAIVRVSAEDVAGNAEVSTATSIAFDRESPIVAIACDGGACSDTPTNHPVEVSLSATARSGVAVMRYTIDGSEPSAIAGVVYTGPFTVSATTTVKFVAVSGAGITSDVGSQLIRIDTSPPSATILLPFEGQPVIGFAWIFATATDDDSIVRVRLLLDGQPIDVRTSAPYRFLWRVGQTSTGWHQLTVEATDAAGNATVSRVVHVFVIHV